MAIGANIVQNDNAVHAISFSKNNKVVGWFTPDDEANIDYKGSPSYFCGTLINLFSPEIYTFCREHQLSINVVTKITFR